MQEVDRVVVMMQGARKQVLACESDPAELHRLLTNLPVLGQHSADDLCQEAAILLKQHPPDKLAAKAHLTFMWYVRPSMQAVWADTNHVCNIPWPLHRMSTDMPPCGCMPQTAEC